MAKKFVTGALALVLLTALAGCNSAGKAKTPMRAGTYTATVAGMHGPLSVEVRLSTGAITDVKVTSNVETPGVSTWAIEGIPRRIVEQQTLAVDVVTGVSITSGAIIRAVEDCLSQADANLADFRKAPPRQRAADETLSADVVIVGGGGAGLAAAVAATEAGAKVILIEKTGFLGGNSIVCGGGYNSVYPERQDHWPGSSGVEKLITDALAERPVNEEHQTLIATVRTEFEAFKRTDKTLFDSPSWHALQTWNGGDKVATLKVVQAMTNNSLSSIKWLESMGMRYEDGVAQGTGAMYPRTYMTADPNGTGYIQSFRGALARRGANYTQLMETTGKSLIVEGGKVVGVNAEAKDGHKVTLRASKGVILATGGFAGNVALRQQYCEGEKWPDLGPSLGTTNMPAVTGDGLFMARDAGANLVNMEHIQLLQVANPETGATGDHTEPQGVAGYIFVNKNGSRFVREDGRRDDISKAILAQPDGMTYLVESADAITNPNEITTVDGRTITYMLENNLSGYVKADTLDDLARILGMSADALKRSVDSFNSHVDSQTPDEFGRVLFSFKYTKGPWYAYPRKPAAHHTMGGVLIDENTHALRADGSVVPGLYCAGEITGVVHGSNRLGGNATADFTVFGRLAGTTAATGR
jgi:flavocytochrome c